MTNNTKYKSKKLKIFVHLKICSLKVFCTCSMHARAHMSDVVSQIVLHPVSEHIIYIYFLVNFALS